jgi:PepSY-associated TM region
MNTSENRSQSTVMRSTVKIDKKMRHYFVQIHHWLRLILGMFIDLSTVEIETATAKVRSASKVSESPLLFQVILTVVALHYGTLGGLTTQILYLAIGLMPIVLLTMGYLMWRQR